MNFFLFFHLANRNADVMVGAGATMLNHVSIIHILEMIEPQNRRNLERDSWNVPWDPCICNSILVKPLFCLFHNAQTCFLLVQGNSMQLLKMRL